MVVNAAMTIRYTLGPDDYLQLNLFVASRTPQVKRRGLRNRTVIPALYLLIGLLLWMTYDSTVALVVMGAAAIVWAMIYPMIQKRLYTRQYKAHIAETYKNRFGKETELTLTPDELHIRDGFGESRIRMDQANGLFRLGTHVFLRFTNGVHVIFPLNQIAEKDALMAMLKEAATRLSMETAEHDHLKW